MTLGSRDDRWLSINDDEIRELIRDMMERLNQIDVRGDGLYIPVGFIKSAMIGDGAVTSTKYGADSIPGTAYKDASIGTAKVADGFLTADATGRAKMADGFATLAKLATDVLAHLQGTPTFTVGVESSDTINVEVQLVDAGGTNVASKQVVRAWLSDTAGGALTSVVPNNGLTIGSRGILVDELVPAGHIVVVTDANGRFDLDIGETGVDTWYMNVEYAGKLYTSDAITFA